MRLRLAGIVLVAAIGATAACTSSSPATPVGHTFSTGTSASTPRPTDASVPVVGRFEAVGGPAGAAPSRLSGRVTFLPLASRGLRGGQPKPISVPASNGRFRAWLRPSSYDVFGVSPQFDGGHAKCVLRPLRPLPFFGTATHRIRLYCERR